MRNFFIASVIALIATSTAFAQAPTINNFKPGQPTCIPVGTQGFTTSINILGANSQGSNIVVNNGSLAAGTQLLGTNYIHGGQSTQGSINLTVNGKNQNGATATIFNEGFAEGSGKLYGDGKLGIGSSFEGRMQNFIKLDANTPTGSFVGGEKGQLPVGISLTATGQLNGGSTSILGVVNRATEADVKDALGKDPKSTLKVGDVIGLQQGGFATNNASGAFTSTLTGVPTGPNISAVNGGSIAISGNNYVNVIPGGFFSGSSSVVTINVPVSPMPVNIPGGSK